MIKVITQVELPLEDRIFLNFMNWAKREVMLNPDGSIHEAVKKDIPYTAFVDAFTRLSGDQVEAKKKGLSWQERQRYETYYTNGIVYRRRIIGW